MLAERYPDVGVDHDVWADAIAQWLTPLSPSRPWRVLAARHRPAPVGVLAPAVHRRLAARAGTRPQPVCEEWCRRTHQEAA